MSEVTDKVSQINDVFDRLLAHLQERDNDDQEIETVLKLVLKGVEQVVQDIQIAAANLVVAVETEDFEIVRCVLVELHKMLDEDLS